MAKAQRRKGSKTEGWSGKEDSGMGNSGVGKVLSAFLNAGVALPFLKELLEFSKVDTEKLLKRAMEQIPLVKDIYKEGRECINPHPNPLPQGKGLG